MRAVASPALRYSDSRIDPVLAAESWAEGAREHAWFEGNTKARLRKAGCHTGTECTQYDPRFALSYDAQIPD